MGANDVFPGELVEGSGEAFGHLAAVDEEDGGGALADDFEQARVDGVPDGDTLGLLRGWAGGNLFLARYMIGQAGHVFYGDFDAQLELLGGAGVDDGDRAVA